MEWFQTKWDLLAAVNKDRGDTRWVDRQMAKGLIGHSEDGYYFVLDFLWWNNGELRKENEMLRERLDGGSYDKNVIKEGNISDLEEAKAQWEYWEWVARQYGRYCNDIMDVCYNKCKQVMGSKFTESRESFKDGIGEMIRRPEE